MVVGVLWGWVFSYERRTEFSHERGTVLLCFLMSEGGQRAARGEAPTQPAPRPPRVAMTQQVAFRGT